MKPFSAALTGLALIMAVPVLADPASHGHHAERKYNLMFQGISEAGRVQLRGVMMDARSPDNRAEIRAARMKILDLVDEEDLNVAAIQRAQAEERAIVARHAKARQDAMLAAIRKLSPADRKAFSANMRQMDGRMEERMKRVRGMMHEDRMTHPAAPAASSPD